jgi:hypothetical protein
MALLHVAIVLGVASSLQRMLLPLLPTSKHNIHDHIDLHLSGLYYHLIQGASFACSSSHTSLHRWNWALERKTTTASTDMLFLQFIAKRVVTVDKDGKMVLSKKNDHISHK